jgi:hypothetical protein
VTTAHDPQASFAGFRTYDWLPDPATVSPDPRIHDNTLLDQRTRAAVERVLAAKGFQRLQSGEADFLTGYYAALDKKTAVTVVDNHCGYRGPWGFPIDLP